MSPREEQYFTIFNEASDGIVIMNDEGKITNVNRSLCLLLDYSRQELLNMNITELFDPAQLKDDPIAFELVKNDQPVIKERRLQKKDGSVIEMELNIKRITLNKVGYFVAQVEDITEKKESALKYKNLLERSLVGIYIHQNGHFKYANPRMTEIFGYTNQELLEIPVRHFIHEDDVHISREMIRQRLSGEAEAIHYEVRGIKKDQTIIWLEIYGSVIMHKGEKAVIGNIQDVTERKRADAEFRRINHAIGERVKELNCLYLASELTNAAGKTIEDILEELVHIIPPSYQYPEITTARITFGNRVFESGKFAGSIWKQDAAIKINNANAGLVEVFYACEMPKMDEGPFLKEERSLINSVAEIVGSAAERKNAEALVKEQSETFQAIIENTKEAIYLIAADYKILQFNKTAFARILKVRGKELQTGTDFRDYLFPDTCGIFYAMFEDSLKGIYRTEEIDTQDTAADHFWFQTKTSPVYSRGNELIGVLVLTEDINERKRAEVVLKESEAKFRSIVEQSLAGIYIIQHGKLAYINPGFEKLFGYSKEQLLNKKSLEGLVHEDDIELVRQWYMKRIGGEKEKAQYIFRVVRKDGVVLHVEVIASAISYNDKPAVIGTLIDITGRIEEERRINQAVLDAQESERFQIGMELHDNVKQILAASGLFLDIAQTKLDDRDAAAEVLDNLKQYNTDAIDELRRLSHQLAPLVEPGTKLNDKITWLIKSLKMDEVLSVSVHIDEFKKPPDNNTQLTFYRILQEQLSNILKYARASAVEIAIRSVNQQINLQVRDNGRGFDINTKKEGIGLENIRRRVHMLNGKVEIISSPGKGCEINVLFPNIQ